MPTNWRGKECVTQGIIDATAACAACCSVREAAAATLPREECHNRRAGAVDDHIADATVPSLHRIEGAGVSEDTTPLLDGDCSSGEVCTNQRVDTDKPNAILVVHRMLEETISRRDGSHL